VVSIHDLAYEHFPEFFHPVERLRLKALVPAAARAADHILTVSNFSARDIRDRYQIPPEKITVTYLAAADKFRPRDKQLCQEYLAKIYGIDGPFILYVGRIQTRKNLLRLVEAYARVRRQGVAPRLVLVGRRDWQFEHLLAKIDQLRLCSSVICPGYVSADDLPFFYNSAELCVFPSIFEGFGLPVVESMASGVPTITSYGSSLEEVAGDAALLVDPFDVSSIADAIQRILGDSKLQNQLVARGLRRSSEFTAEDLGQKALGVYRSL
jgi:glycosyltransferase involved in cell wall biosynthesis